MTRGSEHQFALARRLSSAGLILATAATVLLILIGSWQSVGAEVANSGTGESPTASGNTPGRAADLSLSPQTADALKRESYYHFFLEDYLSAATRLKLLEQSVRDDADTLNHVRLLRGSLYVAWGMHRPATVMFDHLVSAFPPGTDRNQVLLLIERLQYSRALYQAALTTYGRLTHDPSFASWDHAAYLAGMSHYALGNFEQALDTMAAIPGPSSYSPFAMLTAAKSHAQLASIDEAAHLLEQVGGLRGSDDVAVALADQARLTLGYLFTEVGRHDKALPVFASIQPHSTVYPDALFGTGWSHLYQRRYAESLAAFLTLLHVAPDHPYALEALTTVGHCYDRMGARGEALRAYGRALDTYDRERQVFARMKQVIENRGDLATLLADFSGVLDSPLGPLLDDDGLRFWVRQYGELLSIDSYLARKLEDVAVFAVMVDHRAEVFRDRSPIVRQFVERSPALPLRDRRSQIEALIDQALRHETPEAWATAEETIMLRELADGNSRSQSVGQRLAQASGESSRQRADLVMQWTNADRWLTIMDGELAWRILTDVPARRDDRQRTMRLIEAELLRAEQSQRTLVASISGLDAQLDEFRTRIVQIRRDLSAYRTELDSLRAQLLPPLQQLLSAAVDRRSSQMEAMAAVARLSQIHMMDVMTQ